MEAILHGMEHVIEHEAFERENLGVIKFVDDRVDYRKRKKETEFEKTKIENLSREAAVQVEKNVRRAKGLFHDVGYPLQIAAGALVNPFGERINQIKRKLGSRKPDLAFGIDLMELADLNNNVNSIHLIQAKLDQWALRIDAHQIFADMVKTGNTYHGMVSSLAVLYVIDLLYQEVNPNRVYDDVFSWGGVNFNQKYFDGDVVSACSAIFIHDLPKKFFAEQRIDRFKAPEERLIHISHLMDSTNSKSKEELIQWLQNNFKGFALIPTSKPKLQTE